MTEETLPKWARLTGDARSDFERECVALYVEQELSIREIVRRTGRSYGAVHKLLTDAGVPMRPRGNPTRV